jgi:serine/threonine-protein kinase
MPRLLPEKLLAALRAETPARAELPGELSRESRGRVRVAALIGVLAYAVFLVFEPVRLAGASPLEKTLGLANDLVGLGLCAALGLVATWRAIPDRAVFAIALDVEVIVCVVVSVAAPWASFLRSGHVFALTWVVPVIILFPLVVPTPPGTTLLVSTICALTMPAGIALLAARGLIAATASDVIGAGVSGAVAVVIAMIAARTVYGAARQRAAAESVGSYELLERLGQGGMGEVWKARHAFLARDAAVKLILPEQLQGKTEAREEVVTRFTHEAQVTAGLRSPHTVELFDFGVAADGRLFYAMELLDGLNAEHFVYRFGAVEPRRVVHWLTQVCHSLGEAHAHGVVHRDLKPANLFLCRFGRDVDFVKVLDFGLARPVSEPVEQRLTSPQVRLGSPGWMAPEQVFGLPTDARTDVYAMGCIAWWLLAGRKPFEAESSGELMRLHASVPPPALAEQCPQPVPSRLAALVAGCLAKDPSDRPADADRLAAALEESLDGERWTASEARDWWREHLPDVVGS